MNSRPDSVLIIGGASRIGAALAARLSTFGLTVRRSVRRPDPRDPAAVVFDLSADPAAWPRLPDAELVVLCAGATQSLDASPHATAVNVRASTELAAQALEAGRRFIFLSTSQVFDGAVPAPDEDAPKRPLTPYGAQKSEAEDRMRALGGDLAIVRMTKVLASDDARFGAWADALRDGAAIQPFDDMVFSPLTLDEAATRLAALALGPGCGVFQLSGSADISYADAARRLAQRLGADPILVAGVSAETRGVPAGLRPRHATLGVARAAAAIGFRPPSPIDALDAVFDAGFGACAPEPAYG